MKTCIVVGAGIAGAATAFELAEAGLDVLVLESKEVCSGGSAAAGAFLSPKISKPSAYKTYLNTALAYSLAFYEKHFPPLLQKRGLLKLPLNKEDRKRLESYEPYIDIAWQKHPDGYFFPDAGIIPPHALCRAMLSHKRITVHTHRVDTLKFENDRWYVDDLFEAKYLILATGATAEPLPLPYLRTKYIGGYRYDIRFDGDTQLCHNIHKDLSLSLFTQNRVILGATHIREKIDLHEAAKEDRYRLVERAQAFYPMPNLKILRHYVGYRRFTFDYFPVVGEAVDAKATHAAYPYIRSGAKVPFEKYRYFKGLYLHTALGSRGFVFAPWNARLLREHILKQKAIPNPLLPATRFMKWAHKQTR